MSKRKKEEGRAHPLLDRALRPFLDQVFKEPGFGECTQLCDVGTVERVCEMVPEAFEVAGLGHEPGLLPSLRFNLYEPLFRFAQESERWAQEKRAERVSGGLGENFIVQELEATVLFMDQLDEIFEALQQGPWSDEDALQCESMLRSSWLKRPEFRGGQLV